MGHLQTAADAAKGEWKPKARANEGGEVDFANAPWLGYWTPEFVGRCMIEAFRIDRSLPRIERPKAPGSAHPQIEYSEEEREAWEEIPLDPERMMPSPLAKARMETIFEWLTDLRDGSELQFALKNWAMRRASGTSDRRIAGKLGMVRVTLTRRRDRALSAIASRLNAGKMSLGNVARFVGECQ